MSTPKKPLKMSKDELKKKLTPMQYKVTQEEGTEAPFQNEYWDHHEAGIYVDLVTGDPLFSSLDKYDSGTGWPSFTKPIDGGELDFRTDQKLGMKRTEVRAKDSDAHLGHVFDDGPGPGGQRFCMNSAALRFVSLKDMEKDPRYAKYLPSFQKKNEQIVLAGGCFWGMEDLIRKQPGVIDTEVGYAGGSVKNATYALVKTGATGHAESVRITFDPGKTDLEAILKFFFKIHDPTTRNQQGNDIGTQYRSAIFYGSPEQKKIAEKVLADTEKSGKWKKPIVTEIKAATEFWKAEDYHQDYLIKNPGGYTCHYIRE